ncbi:MAG: hypothetical protein DRJ14_08675 [Acidobacteria bacterium]|nr:MAG: hypothetical protein DRJ14_08675 [Acidobacteriota bacterium]
MNKYWLLFLGVVAVVACTFFLVLFLKTGESQGISIIPSLGKVGPGYILESALSEEDKQAIGKSHNVFDLFDLVGIVKLETTLDDFIVYARNAFILGEYIFILDNVQNKIYRFRQDGSFAGTIGKTGQGPGEFQRPHLLKKVFDNYLGVYCAGTGKILIYDQDGQFIMEYNPQKYAKNRILGFNFIWERKDRLIRNGFRLFKGKEPSVANVMLNPMDKNRIIGGFGMRQTLPGNLCFKVEPSTFAFNQIGDTIWYGLPFSTDVELFSADGKFIKRIKNRGQDRLQPSDFHGIQSTKSLRYRELYNKKRKCFGIFSSQNMVCVEIGGGNFDVYSKAGELLCKDVSNDRQFPTFFTGEGNTIMSFRSHVLKSSELINRIQAAGLELPEVTDEDTCLFLFQAKY